MRTYLKWGVATALLGTLAYLVWGFTTQLSRKKAVAQRTQTLPACTVQPISGEPFTLTSAGKPTVLIYFDPDCDHCQREARALRKEGAALANATVVMLSSAPVPALKTFTQTYQLASVPGLRVAHIDRQVAHDTFGFATVPDVLIYHADGTLSHRFKGETSIAAIARHL
ncbi:peroxiredoxin family protein [Fibrella aquatica]|jgi:glutaredoxin|uniref:peroxiredoxin family protein n=1 Tax=Fibrella aquatica TaxID=3242487 RepID=UPI003522F399